MSAEVQLTTHFPVELRAREMDGAAFLILQQHEDSFCLSGNAAKVRALLVQALAAHDAQWPREPERCPHCRGALDADGRCPHASADELCDFCGATLDKCECLFVLTEAGRRAAEAQR